MRQSLCTQSNGGGGVYVSFYEYLFVKHVVVQGCVNP